MKAAPDGPVQRVFGALVAALGVCLAAGAARAALVTVRGTETWNGLSNPHTADGVTLVTNAGPVYVYTVPDGMLITNRAAVNMGVNHVTVRFLNGGLQIDAGGRIDADMVGSRYNSRTITLDLGTNSLTGNGDIRGTYTAARDVHSVSIRGTGNVALNAVDLRINDTASASLSVRVAGTVTVGSVDVSAPSSGGGSSGNVTVRARSVAVGAVNAYAYSGTSGAIRLDALAYPYFGYQAWATNAHANALTLNGVIRTKGTTGAGLSGGSVVANGVNVTLGAGFNTNFNANGTFALRCGLGGAGHFTDNSGRGLSAAALVSHVEHPHAGARRQLIVYTNEVWDGAANPRAADGVTLNAGTRTYTLPTELYVTQTGTMNMGQPAATSDVKLSFTNGGFRMDSGANMAVTVGRYVGTKLTLDLGGHSVLGAGTIAGGSATGPLGSRTVVVTNANGVALDAMRLLGYESANGSIQITATGRVEIATADTSDLAGGGDSAGNITIRGAQVDVRNAYACCARSTAGASAGNILVEALKPPQFSPSQPINRPQHTLTARGLFDTRGPVSQNQGNITLRGAVVTLDTGFLVDLNGNGALNIYAGNADPRSAYFIENSTGGTFTATHTVQIAPEPKPTIVNLPPAANVVATSARVSGQLVTNGAAPATVYLFRGTTDGTTNEAAWLAAGTVTSFGPYAVRTTFTNTLSGLSSNTVYYWNCMASNAEGRAWAATAGSPSFKTHGRPAVNNALGAADVLGSTATLRGNLYQGGVAAVRIALWADGSAETNRYDFGAPRAEGAFSTNVTGLATATLYHYRCYASNAYGAAWAAAATSFTTRSRFDVSSTEVWDGTANPRAADGVALSTNAGPVYIYAIPAGMRITGSGRIDMNQSSVTLRFLDGGLHMDAGGRINADTTGTRWPGSRTLTLDLGVHSITGAGDIRGSYPASVGMRNVVITGTGGVALNSVDLRNADAQNASLSVVVGGPVAIGSVDVSGPSSGGGSSGNVTVRAPQVTVGAVGAWSYGGTPGAIRLNALAYPYFGYQAWATNAHANALTLNGVIRTRGVTGGSLTGGSVVADGVNVVLGAGFNTNLNAGSTWVLRSGLGGAGHFTDNSGHGFTATQLVSHVEHPHADPVPQLIVYQAETWDGAANPRAAAGVTLAGGVYTLPRELYVTQIGGMDLGDLANVTLRFTAGGFRLDAGATVAVTVGRYTSRALTLDLGGFDVTGAGTIAGGTSVGPLGSRTVVVTNAGDVAVGTIALIGFESQNGDLRVAADGRVAVGTVDASDQSGGGDSAGNITIRGAEVDVRNAYAYCARSDLSGLNAGNILIEALMPPWFDWARRVNTRANALVARGAFDTRGPRPQNQGNITLRGAVVTLDTGFQLDLNANGVFQVHAGDAFPRGRYFVDRSAAGPFAAVHDVQLVPVAGTVFSVR